MRHSAAKPSFSPNTSRQRHYSHPEALEKAPIHPGIAASGQAAPHADTQTASTSASPIRPGPRPRHQHRNLSIMAPQGEIPLAANVLGTIGTICWCVQLMPQIWRNYRTKSTEGLPPTMMFLWSASGVPFGAYAIAQKFNIPLIVQPQCFCVLCGVSWAQCLIYGRCVETTLMARRETRAYAE